MPSRVEQAILPVGERANADKSVCATSPGPHGNKVRTAEEQRWFSHRCTQIRFWRNIYFSLFSTASCVEQAILPAGERARLRWQDYAPASAGIMRPSFGFAAQRTWYRLPADDL